MRWGLPTVDDFLFKAASALLDKLGVGALAFIAPAALCLWLMRVNGGLRTELDRERAARFEDLKTVLPVIQASTAATQSTGAALTKLDGSIQQLTIAQMVHGGSQS